ncbi:unnamed protein product [Gongylonema pulchrum]|uniref:Myosin_tail_1 domain-containing protein n=1 Tax=Gongylonema pulchrum TaxID=637853 RepID=A0A183E971_9BILA|nr:unnamed protein product [Gongylonema pulchrum]
MLHHRTVGVLVVMLAARFLFSLSIMLTKRIQECESQNKLLRSQCENAEKRLEFMREEKSRAEELMEARIDHQVKQISELRNANGKLRGDLELQKQTQLMLKEQLKTDTSGLTLVRENYAKMESNYKNASDSCKKLMDELMETKGEVAKYKTDVESLTRQIRLQRIDEKKIQGLEEQLTAAKNENESLKKFVGDITEQHRSFSLDLKMMLNKVQTERDQALASRKSVEDQLSLKEREVSGLQARYDDLMNQMKSLDSASDDAGHREEMHQLRSRISYLENRLTVVSRDLEASNKQLAIRECEIAEVSKLSSSMETTILEQGAVSLTFACQFA